ncbi:MAG: hypothetical protein ABH871_07730 [Pseudomonadota bacterium]
MRRIILIFAGICVIFTASVGAKITWANQAISLNISQLMQADVAFTGTCTKAQSRVMKSSSVAGGLLVTTYTFEVSEILKGDVPAEFSFTQWGASRNEAFKLGKPFVYGPPLYEIGKEYTLLLTSPSRLGLRAPVGLGQGKFTVIKGPEGKVQVVNQTGNKGLFTNLPATKAMTKALSAGGIKRGVTVPTGPMDYSNFKEVVKNLNEKE